MSHWFEHAILYHIYAPAACGAPRQADPAGAVTPRLDTLRPWLAHARSLGATAIVLGPVCESMSHGYDTVDLFQVDRRLGDDRAMAGLVEAAHAQGLRVLLDAVFGHVGRAFPAFRELQARGSEAAHAGWFRGVDFGRRGPLGERFAYEFWRDAPELARLETRNPEVRAHLLDAVDAWVARWGIDGLRVDSADHVDDSFLAALCAHCAARHPGLAVFGEVVHGDYRRFAGPGRLHGVTDYELHKGLWSSLADGNLFELAHGLTRQFGQGGLYRGLPLVQFVDNHDVDRAVERVGDRALLFPLYCLLFTIPGVPAVYQGSEWGIGGRRTATDDTALRPTLELAGQVEKNARDLPDAISRLARLRSTLPALADGGYRQLHVASHQLAFLRHRGSDSVVVAVNAADAPVDLTLHLPGLNGGTFPDRLNPPECFAVRDSRVSFKIPARWARVLVLEDAR